MGAGLLKPVISGTIVGEMTAHPKYYSYIGLVAPSDKMAVYMPRNFWLLFAILGVVASVGMILYNRWFAADTPRTNALARTIMTGVYGVLVLLGGWFLYLSVKGDAVAYKTLVQAGILLVLGAGGLVTSIRGGRPA